MAVHDDETCLSRTDVVVAAAAAAAAAVVAAAFSSMVDASRMQWQRRPAAVLAARLAWPCSLPSLVHAVAIAAMEVRPRVAARVSGVAAGAAAAVVEAAR